ncbi:MAG: inositol monophosphatase family protein [Gammaproteobacteria bacterium]
MTHPVLNVATQAAHAAGETIRRRLRDIDAVPVAKKARHDYVSEVDRICEEQIVREISRFYPDHAFLGEEGGVRGEGDVVWIIDPLDGTANFLHGMPHFAVSIAQQVRGRVEHGVVYDPVRDELYTASRGKGAYLNQRRIRVSQRTVLDDAILATAFPFRQRQLMPVYTRIFSAVFRRVEDVRRGGSAALERRRDRLQRPRRRGGRGQRARRALQAHDPPAPARRTRLARTPQPRLIAVGARPRQGRQQRLIRRRNRPRRRTRNREVCGVTRCESIPRG